MQASSSRVAKAEHAASCTLLLGSSTRCSNCRHTQSLHPTQQWHHHHLSHESFQELVVGLGHDPVSIAGEGPAGDGPHQGLGVREGGDEEGDQVREVGLHARHAALRHCPQSQDGRLLLQPVLQAVGRASSEVRHWVWLGSTWEERFCLSRGRNTGRRASLKTLDSTSRAAAEHLRRFQSERQSAARFSSSLSPSSSPSPPSAPATLLPSVR